MGEERLGWRLHLTRHKETRAMGLFEGLLGGVGGAGMASAVGHRIE